jgi:hypothetical protein
MIASISFLCFFAASKTKHKKHAHIHERIKTQVGEKVPIGMPTVLKNMTTKS